MTDPLQLLDRWLEEAREAGTPVPAAMTLASVGADGRPSARVVSLKRLEDGALIFCTGLWTRKAEELRANPRVAAVLYWPTLGRQARIEGSAELAGPELAEELFAARPRDHQLQAHASRQGETIGDLDSLRARLETLQSELADRPVPRPEDWGAFRIRPDLIEFWAEGADRLHDRRQYRAGPGGWDRALLAP